MTQLRRTLTIVYSELWFSDLAVYALLSLDGFRFLDTSLCDVDVQPTYVRAYIKGKVCSSVFLLFSSLCFIILPVHFHFKQMNLRLNGS